MNNKLLLYLLLVLCPLVKGQNNACLQAIALTVGTDFTSGLVISDNSGATTDGILASCNTDAVDNVWFKVVVPPSGNLTIETAEVSGSAFDDSVLSVYSGVCGSLTEINCDDDEGEGFFSKIILTGQLPGTTLYVSVWKLDSDIDSGEFQISAYDESVLAPSNNDCVQAIPLTIGTDFTSGLMSSSNNGATTDGTLASCNLDAVENVWFKVVVPPSGNLTIETAEVSGSAFGDSVLSVYSGVCGSLTEINCDDDDDEGEDFFSKISLSGQLPGTTLYVSVWKFDSNTDNGEFQISVYDNSVLATNEVFENMEKIKIFPNPFSDIITISDISKIKSVSISDSYGRLIKIIEKPSSASIYLGELKEGFYLISLTMNDGSVKTTKVIKK